MYASRGLWLGCSLWFLQILVSEDGITPPVGVIAQQRRVGNAHGIDVLHAHPLVIATHQQVPPRALRARFANQPATTQSPSPDAGARIVPAPSRSAYCLAGLVRLNSITSATGTDSGCR